MIGLRNSKVHSLENFLFPLDINLLLVALKNLLNNGPSNLIKFGCYKEASL